MNKRRIFIAINLPSDLKRRFLALREKWPNLPVRWTVENNLHLTLVFIGYVSDDELAEICRIINEVVQNHPAFEIQFKRVIYGPPGQTARMIWVEGERSEAAAQLKNDLEDALLASSRSGFRHKENRQFSPHLTLARMKEEWRDFSPKPEIDLEFNEVFPVETIEVMESELKRGGAEYTILESVSLGGNKSNNETI